MDEHLRKFAAVAEHGSFTKAAQEIHVSQPALSMAVRQLERELGVKLFTRIGRSSQLTPAGKIVLEAAQHMRSSIDDLSLRLSEYNDRKPQIRIGLIDSMADLLFARQKTFPEIAQQADVSLTVDASSRLLQATEAGHLHAALIVTPQQSISPQVVTYLLGDEPLAVVCAPSMPQSPTEPIPCISYNTQATTYEFVNKSLDEHGVRRQVLLHSTSPTVMLRLCLQGVGFSVLPFMTVADYLARGDLRYLGGTAPRLIHRPITAITRRDNQDIEVVNHIFKQAKSHIKNAQNSALIK